jgi:hypothetical protein
MLSEKKINFFIAGIKLFRTFARNLVQEFNRGY